VDISNACRTGDCGECKVRRIDGDIVMANRDGLDEREFEDGFVLTCVASINGRVALAA